MLFASPLLIVIAILAFYLFSSIKILNEYERAVVFRLGKLLPQPKGPGVVLVFAPIDRMVRVSLRTIVMDVPPQDVITRDNVSVKVNAVVYFRVMDPRRAIVEVESYHYATSQLAQTTLRSVLGQVELDELLSQREKLNQQLQQILDQHTDAWGIKVTSVEVKHVDLPPDMQRAMARQAEAEREKRAKIIHAEGELQASEKLEPGRRSHRDRTGDGHAALPADADRDRVREELHDHLPAAHRAAEHAWHGTGRQRQALRDTAVSDFSNDATDDGFHEIQLSGKQLVFLFMATTVVSVVIFLCGVLVGRGVRGEVLSANTNKPTVTAAGAQPTTSPEGATSTAPPQVSESATAQPSADGLSYTKRLTDEKAVAENLKAPKSVAPAEPAVQRRRPRCSSRQSQGQSRHRRTRRRRERCLPRHRQRPLRR